MGSAISTPKEEEAIYYDVRGLSNNFDAIIEKQKELTKCAEQVANSARSQEKSVKELQENIKRFKQKCNLQETPSKYYEKNQSSQNSHSKSSIKNNQKEASQNETPQEGQNNDQESEKMSCSQEKPSPPKKPYIFLKEVVDKLSRYEEENKKMSITVKELKTETTRLNEAICDIASDKQALRENVDKISNLQKDNESMRKAIDELKSEAETLKRTVGKLTNQNEEFKAYVNKTEGEIQRLYQKCEKLEKTLIQKETVHVVLYCPEQQKLANEALFDLNTKLVTQMAVQSCDLLTQLTHDVQNRTSGVPLILLCIKNSRLGTDVDRAFQNIQYEHSVALVILHYAKSHALPSRSSEHLLTEAKYKQLGMIVDLAYVTEEGIYACDMNNTSLNKLCEFIKRFI